MTQQERISRIIARGEVSGHAHIITGDAVIERNSKGEILINIGQEDCVLKHLLESDWLNGKEVWTKEHHDINLTELDKLTELGGVLGRHGDVALLKVGERKYQYIQQRVFDPLTKRIENAKD